jgi:outer membrane protein assembly factor BamB
MTILGKKTYVYSALGGVIAVSAEGDDVGKMLWQTRDWNPSMSVASPIYIGNGEIMTFGSYGAGTAKIRITRNASGFSATVTERHRPLDGISSEQHTPILLGDYVWVVLPESAGFIKRQLACYHKNDLATPVWTSGNEGRFGKGMGPYVMSGDKLYLLDDEGGLFLFRIENNRSATLLASHKLFDAIEAWAPMALAGNYLILRDAHNMLCIDISKID